MHFGPTAYIIDTKPLTERDWKRITCAYRLYRRSDDTFRVVHSTPFLLARTAASVSVSFSILPGVLFLCLCESSITQKQVSPMNLCILCMFYSKNYACCDLLFGVHLFLFSGLPDCDFCQLVTGPYSVMSVCSY